MSGIPKPCAGVNQGLLSVNLSRVNPTIQARKQMHVILPHQVPPPSKVVWPGSGWLPCKVSSAGR